MGWTGRRNLAGRGGNRLCGLSRWHGRRGRFQTQRRSWTRGHRSGGSWGRCVTGDRRTRRDRTTGRRLRRRHARGPRVGRLYTVGGSRAR
eukprot:scaffold5360_cov213-Amphora_coffeaeformis.AAC.5